MNGILFIDSTGNLQQVKIGEILIDCPSKKYYEWIEYLLKNQNKKKREEYTKQAIEEIRQEEDELDDEEEDEYIGELFNIIDELAETVIRKYMKIKERRENGE